jgi:uncharacterized membrane protein YphA (DoxX/SURF4 family)/thiol-disulfide isomerase/thioredoxin
MGTILLAARVLLAVVFATAGIAKLLDRQGTRSALEGFGVPSFALSPGSLLLPLAELATAFALVPQQSAQWGGLAALVLLLAFIGGIANAMTRGQAPDCHCFGQLHSEPAGRGTLGRNIALAALAGLVAVEGPGPDLPSWIGDRGGAELVATSAGIAAAVLGALAISLWRENRTLKRGLDQARTELATFPPGLPVGTVAPSFALRSLTGESVTLESLCARGQPVALVFISPTCGPCSHLLPKLAGWQGTLADSLTVAVVSEGTHGENLALVQDSTAQVLLQEGSEVLQAYRVEGTPASVLVSAEGRISSAAASGAFASESLIRLALRQRHRLGSPSPQGKLPSAGPVA